MNTLHRLRDLLDKMNDKPHRFQGQGKAYDL